MEVSLMASRATKAGRRLATFLAVLLVASGSLFLAPTPVRAGLFNPIPADFTGDPQDQFVDDDYLFAYMTSDLLGGRICIVDENTTLASAGTFPCNSPVWGSPNTVVGIGTIYTLIENPTLWPGTWRLITENTIGEPLGLSIPFTVTPCPDCDRSLAAATAQAFKDSMGTLQDGASLVCTAWQVKDVLEGVTGIAGEISAAHAKVMDLTKRADAFENGTTDFVGTILPIAGGAVAGGIAFPSFDTAITIGEEKAKAILQALVCSLKQQFEDIHDDPPDPDYTTVDEPTFRPIDPLGTDVDDALAAAFDEATGYSVSILHALERYQGAAAAFSSSGIRRQTNALATNTLGLIAALRATAADLRDYADQIDSGTELGGPIIETSDIRDSLANVYARVRTSGFTADELQQLTDRGFSADEITDIASHFALDPATIPVGVTLPDVARDVADTLEAQIPALDAMAREAAAVAARANSGPSAFFTADPVIGGTPLEITFSNLSSDPDGDPLTYLWTFDDGTTSTEASPTHTFTDVRNYLVRLDATDGLAGSFWNAFVTVTPPGTPPTASFTVPRYTYLVGDTIHLVDESTDLEGPIVSRIWSDFWGTFSDQTGIETDFTFQNPGTSQIRLDVTDEDGWSSAIERSVTSFTSLPIPSRAGCSAPIAGTSQDSVGNEFMLAFPGNYQGFQNALLLYIAADEPTTGFVEVPGFDFEQDFTVTPGTATQVVVPSAARLAGSDLVTVNGIRVCADHEVSVYGNSLRGSTTDAYLGLPTDSLGTDYLVMSYPADLSHFVETSDERSQLAVVGTADATNVVITPSIDVGGHPAGVPFVVDLGRFMTYQLRADHDREDLTGTIIHADHDVAVFGGDSCTDIPAGASACDHIVEQLAPTRTWGTSFSIVSLAARTSGDLVRVLARQSDTAVTLDGDVVATLDPGQFVELDLASGSTHEIQASGPVLVAQFAKSLEVDGLTGDPFMAMVSPNQQFADHYTLVSLPGFNNYLNLVVEADSVATCVVDGAALVDAGQTIGSSGLVGIRETVGEGSHVVACATPFGITAYGWSTFESYGYPGGSRLATIGQNQPPIGLPDGYVATFETTLVVPASLGVLANDSDADGDALAALKVGDPAHGSISLASDGSFSYTPAGGYVGADAFTYDLTDGIDTAGPITVSIAVGAANHDPVLSPIADQTVHPGELVAVTATASDSDVPADTLTYSLIAGPPGAAVDGASGAFSWTAGTTLGDVGATIGVDDGAGGTDETSFTIHVVRSSTTLTLGGDSTGQYTDPVTITASLDVAGVGVAGQPVTISLGAASISATTDASGVASATFIVPGPAGNLVTTGSFAGSTAYAPSSASGSFGATREDAEVIYSGDTIALAGAPIHLGATVLDSGAGGYAGPHPETGAGTTIGDLTKAHIAFAIYSVATCLSGSPIAILSAAVVDTGAVGDGIGTAAVTWTSSTEGSFCVVPSLVATSGTGSNGYYVAPPATAGGIAVFVDVAGKVTGGGWVALGDGRANFAFNASSNRGKVKGSLLFVERTVYGGTRAILIVKSNAIETLRTSGKEYPITATLSGKASFKYISSTDGSTLFESGNATFTATVLDTGSPGGASDAFAISVADRTGSLLVDVGTTLLGSGNIVAHLK
jgi:PKD repeat protein